MTLTTQKPLLVVVAGPTAVGKTAFCIRLAQHFDSEIISADSRQFYKEMHIGTAKPEPEELAQVPHHFVGHLSIHEPYSVGDYERDALALVEQLHKRHRVVFVTGGSGLYLRALTEGLDHFPEVPQSVRDTVQQGYEQGGLAYLQVELAQRDPEYLAVVDRSNPRRLIRALEVCLASGQPFTSFHNQPRPERPFEVMTFFLERNREKLYERINERVLRMIADGLLDEVKSLRAHAHLQALQTVGYQELFGYLDGDLSLSKAVELIQRNTRRYAKRQLTWYRSQEDVIRLKPRELERAIELVEERL